MLEAILTVDLMAMMQNLAPVERLMAAVLNPAEPVPLPPLMEAGKAGPTPETRRDT